MLCAHKNLVTMKLEEMVALKESKTERKREKQAVIHSLFVSSDESEIF